MAKDNWTREQTIIALNLYCKIPFNRVTERHEDIIRIANIIGRKPNAVKMKIGNFGSFDPELKRKGIVGLSNASKLDEEIWNEYNSDWDRLGYESELLIAKYSNTPIEETINADIDLSDLSRGTTRDAIVKVRVNQGFFRATVLSSYNLKCCITGLAIPDLLVASHIVPWGKDDQNRLNPRNGLCLNSIHDKAFDKGLITITHDYKVKISNQVKKLYREPSIQDLFLKYENKSICTPDRFVPEKEFLSYHHTNVFRE
jgi:putative restriction endonuclease